MTKSKKFRFILLSLLILFLAFKTFRFFQIDSCLDSGGNWNYSTNECNN
jgi:membrane protein CcdC involved in cytochrome C biogenesis